MGYIKRLPIFFHEECTINCDVIKQQPYISVVSGLLDNNLKKLHYWDLVLIVLQLMLERHLPKMQFKKGDQKAELLLHHIRNIAELNGKNRTDLKEFRLAQSERQAVVAKKKKRIFFICNCKSLQVRTFVKCIHCIKTRFIEQ